jgi:hypothetical protein
MKRPCTSARRARSVNDIELVSRFSPDVSANRLRAAIDGGLASWFGSKPVVGKVVGHSVRLRKRIGYSNSFQTYLKGTLEPCGEGTVFRGKAGLHPLMAALTMVWFAAAVILCGAFFVTEIRGQPAGLLLILFGMLLVCFGWFLARGEKRFLVAFIAEVLATDQAP